MKKFFTLILLLSFWSMVDCWADDGHQGKDSPKSKNQENKLKTTSPSDTANYSIQINGQSNILKINSEQQTEAQTGKTEIPNTVKVNGEGNIVSVNQPDKKSKVNISQNGKNNQISISQNNQ